MGELTKIQWTDHTFNPWRGCTKVSAGCANCYAERQSHRNPGVLGVWGDRGTRVVAAESAWREPLKWDRAARAAGVRRRVFCASLADVFEQRIDLIAPRWRLMSLIRDTPNLDWLLLTKRPHRVKPDLRDRAAADGIDWLTDWPRNVWLGTSVEDQAAADERIPRLRDIPARVRFLSCEPLLGPVRLDLDGIDWVIVGGESGPGARPCYLGWIERVIEQCREAMIPVFVKQAGTKPMDAIQNSPGDITTYPVRFRDYKGGDPAEWPEGLRVREFPEVA